jgi:hypothetical protein
MSEDREKLIKANDEDGGGDDVEAHVLKRPANDEDGGDDVEAHVLKRP